MTSKIYNNIHHDDGKNISTKKTYRKKVKVVKFKEKKPRPTPGFYR